MLLARKRRLTKSISGDEKDKAAGRKRDKKEAQMGNAVWSQDVDVPKHENPTSLQISSCNTVSQGKSPGETLRNKMCPKCSSFFEPAVVPAGHTTSLLCPQCSTTPLCEHCLYHCHDGACTNKSCQVVSLLLNCDQVTNSESNVYGCPLFRACPNCHSIMMHQAGCKYVRCAHCRHSYCFICLRISNECKKDKDKYWSLTCSAPTAPRQRFQT